MLITLNFAELKRRDSIEESDITSPSSDCNGTSQAESIQEMRDELARIQQELADVEAESARVDKDFAEAQEAHDEALKDLSHIPTALVTEAHADMLSPPIGEGSVQSPTSPALSTLQEAHNR